MSFTAAARQRVGRDRAPGLGLEDDARRGVRSGLDPASAGWPDSALMELQGLAGNGAVVGLLRSASAVPPRPPLSRQVVAPVQREENDDETVGEGSTSEVASTDEGAIADQAPDSEGPEASGATEGPGPEADGPVSSGPEPEGASYTEGPGP
ncbi:MAG: hypothetical protein WCK58_06200, partial [Chloroflexota bacterium]